MNNEKSEPRMLSVDQVAERLNMSKGYAYKVIANINEEQVRKGRPIVKGKVRSDIFENLYFASDDDAGL